jgi:hypothetical protein
VAKFHITDSRVEGVITRTTVVAETCETKQGQPLVIFLNKKGELVEVLSTFPGMSIHKEK